MFHSSIQQLRREQQIAEGQVCARLSGSYPQLLPSELEAKPSSHWGRHAPTETRQDAATLLLTQLTNSHTGTLCTGHMGVIHILSQARKKWDLTLKTRIRQWDWRIISGDLVMTVGNYSRITGGGFYLSHYYKCHGFKGWHHGLPLFDVLFDLSLSFKMGMARQPGPVSGVLTSA